MSYIAPEASQDIPTEAREVYDVSGAGDTVVATLAAALAAGIPIADAIYLANKAAGIVVGKIGTSPILFKELQDELQIGKPASKLIPIPQLADTIKQLRAQERKIIFTNGCFDILHKGHVCYLEKAKRLGDVGKRWRLCHRKHCRQGVRPRNSNYPLRRRLFHYKDDRRHQPREAIIFSATCWGVISTIHF